MPALPAASWPGRLLLVRTNGGAECLFVEYTLNGAPQRIDDIDFLIETICANVPTIHWARLQESPPLFRDAKGHVLFLGDASHGMVPTPGQGATQAVEDAGVAADLLLKRVTTGGARSLAVPEVLPEVLREFESLRAERVRITSGPRTAIPVPQNAKSPTVMAGLSARITTTIRWLPDLGSNQGPAD